MDWIIWAVTVAFTVAVLAARFGFILTGHDLDRIKKLLRSRKAVEPEPEEFSLQKWTAERRKMREQEKREWELEFYGHTFGFKNSKTAEMAAIQRHLRNEGLYSGPCDGHWGEASRRALSIFVRQMIPPGVDRSVRNLADGGEYRQYADGRSEITTPDGTVLRLGRGANPWDDEVRYPYSRRGAPPPSHYGNYENGPEIGPPIANYKRGITVRRYEDDRWSEPYS